jgi:tetratricopeptide (TPR) repeat protein
MHHIKPQASTRLTVGHLEAAGKALFDTGKPGLAVDLFRAALAASPRDPALLTSLSGALREIKQLPDAEVAAREAIAIDRTPRRLVALAGIVRDRERPDEAEETLRDALDLDPDCADAGAALGNLLLSRWHEAGASDDLAAEATTRLQRAIAANPEDLTAQATLLACYQVTDRFERWLEGAEALCQQYPGCHEFELHRAFALMKTGDLKRGLPAMGRSIYTRGELRDCPLLRYPIWHPGDPPGPVVVWNAEGFGDGVQFARYYRFAAQQGAEIKLIANKPEARLMARCLGVSEIIPPDDVTLDRHATVFSLAADFTDSELRIPTSPYLSAPAELVAEWGKRIGSAAYAFKVGVSWRGNPKQDNDRRRSFEVDHLMPLCGLPGVELVNLQHGHRGETIGYGIADLGEEYQRGDWLDTAAVIANLDLVITPCTGIAHLAGAMGKPVWLALSEPGCWRWMTKREDSPWYPTMRIFRQTVRGSWEGVFERMAAELRTMRAAA